MGFFYIAVAGIIAAIICDLIFIPKLVSQKAAHYPDDYGFRFRVRTTAYFAAAVAFLPSVVFGIYLGIISASFLMRQTWLVLGDGAFGASIGMGFGVAIFSGGFTFLASYLAIKIFASTPMRAV